MNCYALEISDVDFSQSSELPFIHVAELTFLEASGTELQVVELTTQWEGGLSAVLIASRAPVCWVVQAGRAGDSPFRKSLCAV